MVISINKPGKSKKELLNYLEKLKTDFAHEISKYDLKLSPVKDGYNLKGSKRILVLKASADINIKAENEKYVIDYTSKNIPLGMIDQAISKVKQILNKC